MDNSPALKTGVYSTAMHRSRIDAEVVLRTLLEIDERAHTDEEVSAAVAALIGMLHSDEELPEQYKRISKKKWEEANSPPGQKKDKNNRTWYIDAAQAAKEAAAKSKPPKTPRPPAAPKAPKPPASKPKQKTATLSVDDAATAIEAHRQQGGSVADLAKLLSGMSMPDMRALKTRLYPDDKSIKARDKASLADKLATKCLEIAKPQAAEPAAPAAAGEAPVAADATVEPLFRPSIVTARPNLTKPADTDLVPEHLRKFLISPDGSDHQLQGAAKMIAAVDSIGGGLLADGPGAGKSRVLLAVAATYTGRGKKVVIVAPAGIIKPDWKNNAVVGSIGKDAAAMGVGLTLNKGDAPIGAGEVHVTTYEKLGAIKDHIDSDTIVIFDESHYIKNADSLRSKQAQEIMSKSAGVVYSTATPADNVVNLAYLFRTKLFGGEDWKKTRRKFNAKDSGAATAQQAVMEMFDRLTEMGAMIKREVSLDGVEAKFEHVELPHEALAALAKIEAETDFSAPFAKALMLMKQRYTQEKYKILAAVKKISSELAEGRQVVLFLAGVSGTKSKETGAESPGTAAMLRQALVDAGVPPDDIGELHSGEGGGGKTVVQAFQDRKVKVIITTAGSGGTGHNLDDTVGDCPRTQIIMTAPFGAIDNAQIWGRTHRLTTRSQSRMVYLFADTDVDQWNADLIRKHVATLGAIVAGETQKQNIPKFERKEDAEPPEQNARRRLPEKRGAMRCFRSYSRDPFGFLLEGERFLAEGQVWQVVRSGDVCLATDGYEHLVVARPIRYSKRTAESTNDTTGTGQRARQGDVERKPAAFGAPRPAAHLQ